MAGIVGLAHEVEDDLVLRHFKVEVHLHAALVGVGRHGVPHAAGREDRHAHGELAGLQHVGMDELVDHALVAGLRRAAGLLGRVGDADQPVLVAAMGRGGHHVELGGLGRMVAGEQHLLGPAGDVQAVLVAQLVHLAVHGDGAGAAHVEHAALPALQEVAGAEVVPHVDALVDGHGVAHGHDAQRHHAVHMAVNGVHLAGGEQGLDQKFLPGLLGVVAAEILRAAGIANVHGSLPFPLFSSIIYHSKFLIYHNKAAGTCQGVLRPSAHFTGAV